MKQTKKEHPNPQLLKVVVAISCFACSFVFKEPANYSRSLKVTAFLVLMIPTWITGIKKNHKNDQVEFFIGIVLLCIDKFDEAIILLTVIELIKYIEESRSWKNQMLKTNPTVLVEKKNQQEEISYEKIKKDMEFILTKGNKVPVDCILEEETAIFHEKQKKFSTKPGDKIIKGSILLSNRAKLKALESYKDRKESILEKEQQQMYQKLDENEKQQSKYMKTILFLLGIFFIFIPNLLTGEIQNFWIYLGVLGLTLMITETYLKEISILKRKMIQKLFQENIGIRNYKALKKLGKVKNVIFEKTDTLTLGEFRLTEINTQNEKKLLEALNYVEYHSNHSIASAIKKYKKIKVDHKKIKEFKETPGKGVECKVGKQKIIAGNLYFLKEKGIVPEKEWSVGTVIYVAVDKDYLGNVVLSDSIKCSIKKVTNTIKEQGISKTSVLSGDNERINKAICQELSIPDQYSNLTPEEKAFWLAHLKEQEKGYTMLIGNKTTTEKLLELADISLILNKTSEIENKGDLYITENHLEKLPSLFQIHKEYRRISIGAMTLYSLLTGITLVLVAGRTWQIWTLPIIEFIVSKIIDIRVQRKWG